MSKKCIDKVESNQADIVSYLYNTYYLGSSDNFESYLSSHWKEFSSRFDVRIGSNREIVSCKGYGFGDLEYRSTTHHAFNYLCNCTYFFRLNYKKDLRFLLAKAKLNLKIIDSFLLYDFFRQVCSLAVIRKYLTLNTDVNFEVLIIGDGYGFLASLIKSVYRNARITLVDIGKVLLFQAVNLQKIFPGHKHLLTKDEQNDGRDCDFLYVPADRFKELLSGRYKLIINIASMQEMSQEMIARYFDFIRQNSRRDNLFYCCNRELKVLSGGETLEFLKYPWHVQDNNLIDEICPFYSYYFSQKFPFFHKFDGRFFHRLSNLKTGV